LPYGIQHQDLDILSSVTASMRVSRGSPFPVRGASAAELDRPHPGSTDERGTLSDRSEGPTATIAAETEAKAVINE
jgi:hypothetical protein